MTEFLDQLDGADVSFDNAVLLFKRTYLLRVLKQCRGNQCKAAERMGVHRNTITRYLDEFEIGRKRDRKS